MPKSDRRHVCPAGGADDASGSQVDLEAHFRFRPDAGDPLWGRVSKKGGAEFDEEALCVGGEEAARE